MENKKYITLKELEVYQISRTLSTKVWAIYEGMNWQERKIMGDQFLSAADSIGANIAEGYGRFHYLDKIRFYYNSRGSMFEAFEHWLELVYERGKITQEVFTEIKDLSTILSVKLNNFISATYQSKQKLL
jgi:four helix bundle protein